MESVGECTDDNVLCFQFCFYIWNAKFIFNIELVLL